LENVTLVGNDRGGALCQFVAARHPERIARLVLTSCDAFEWFPPSAFKYLLHAARIAAAMRWLSRLMRWFPLLQRLPIRGAEAPLAGQSVSATCGSHTRPTRRRPACRGPAPVAAVAPAAEQEQSAAVRAVSLSKLVHLRGG
jgi:pimeloyl-ACP methyl ester carboxylesterase